MAQSHAKRSPRASPGWSFQTAPHIRVLVAVASEETRAALARELPFHAMSLVLAFSVAEAVEHLSPPPEVRGGVPDILDDHSIDLIIIDKQLCGRPCAHVVDVLREGRFIQPVIVLSAEDDPSWRAAVLEAGADLHLVVPVDPVLLVAHVRAQVRRVKIECRRRTQSVTAGTVTLDPVDRVVRAGTACVRLTRREYILLWVLMSHPGRQVGKHQLISAVWGSPRAVSLNTVESTVSMLRVKLDALGQRRCVRTVRGTGYLFDPVADASSIVAPDDRASRARNRAGPALARRPPPELSNDDRRFTNS